MMHNRHGGINPAKLPERPAQAALGIVIMFKPPQLGADSIHQNRGAVFPVIHDVTDAVFEAHHISFSGRTLQKLLAATGEVVITGAFLPYSL
jgi:hypothetical protein